MTSNSELFSRAKKSATLVCISLNVTYIKMRDVRQALTEARALNAALQTLERNLSGVIPPKDGE